MPPPPSPSPSDHGAREHAPPASPSSATQRPGACPCRERGSERISSIYQNLTNFGSDERRPLPYSRNRGRFILAQAFRHPPSMPSSFRHPTVRLSMAGLLRLVTTYGLLLFAVTISDLSAQSPTRLIRPGDFPTGLKGWWKLDEAVGTRADASKDGNDQSDSIRVENAADNDWSTKDCIADLDFSDSDRHSRAVARTGLDFSGPSAWFNLATCLKIGSHSTTTRIAIAQADSGACRGYTLLESPDRAVCLHVNDQSSHTSASGWCEPGGGRISRCPATPRPNRRSLILIEMKRVVTTKVYSEIIKGSKLPARDARIPTINLSKDSWIQHEPNQISELRKMMVTRNFNV